MKLPPYKSEGEPVFHRFLIEDALERSVHWHQCDGGPWTLVNPDPSGLCVLATVNDVNTTAWVQFSQPAKRMTHVPVKWIKLGWAIDTDAALRLLYDVSHGLAVGLYSN
jgi:hypothetical protein